MKLTDIDPATVYPSKLLKEIFGWTDGQLTYRKKTKALAFTRDGSGVLGAEILAFANPVAVAKIIPPALPIVPGTDAWARQCKKDIAAARAAV